MKRAFKEDYKNDFIHVINKDVVKNCIIKG